MRFLTFLASGSLCAAPMSLSSIFTPAINFREPVSLTICLELSWGVIYCVRSPPKFIVWILNSSLKFLLEFYSRIKILHSSFRFPIIRKRCYFLNSTLLFDLARRIFSTRFIKLHLPSHISNSTLKIFNTTSEFSFTLQWVVGGSLMVYRALRLLYKHTNDQINLLSRGLKFVPTPITNETALRK